MAKPTWIVAADGARARIFEERTHGAALVERIELALSAEDLDRPAPRDRPFRVHDSVGEGRHAAADEPSPRDREKAQFVRRLAAHIAEHEAKGAFQALIVFAPPRVLGQLRDAWTDAVRAHITHEDAKDRLDDDARALRAAIESLRHP